MFHISLHEVFSWRVNDEGANFQIASYCSVKQPAPPLRRRCVQLLQHACRRGQLLLSGRGLLPRLAVRVCVPLLRQRAALFQGDSNGG